MIQVKEDALPCHPDWLVNRDKILALAAHFHAVAEKNYRICCLLDGVEYNRFPEVRP